MVKTQGARLRNDIGWCDATANVVLGCAKVSAGCKNCYAQYTPPARILRARGQETWGPEATRHENTTFLEKVQWLNKFLICSECHTLYSPDAEACWVGKYCTTLKCGYELCGGVLRRIRLFADSTSDWLDPAWPPGALQRLLWAAQHCANLDFILLTKRIELFAQRVRGAAGFLEGLPPNVWLGVSAEDQENADKRITELLKVPASVYFVSAEPLLGYVDLRPWLPSERLPRSGGAPALDWAIVGGESGPNRRDCGVDAICQTAYHCVEAGVPVWIKQDCHLRPGQQGRLSDQVWEIKELPQ